MTLCDNFRYTTQMPMTAAAIMRVSNI